MISYLLLYIVMFPIFGTSRLYLMYLLSVIFIFIGFRGAVGVDYYNYLGIFERFAVESFSYTDFQREYLYYALVSYLSSSGYEYYWHNIILAFISILSTGYFLAKRNFPIPLLFYLLPYLILVVYMAGVRQAVAISLVFLAKELELKRGVASFLVMLLAIGFHASATFLLPLIFWRQLRNLKLKVFVMIVTGAFIINGSSRIESTLGYNYIEMSIASSGALFHLMLLILPTLVCFQFNRKETLSLFERSWGFPLLLVSTFYFFEDPLSADRMSLYAYPFVCLLIDSFLKEKNIEPQVVNVVFAIFSAIVFFVWLFFSFNGAAYLNYSNILFD